ncbi:hypothetical protein SacmaDRAFT_2938 [Saccharomonospora marina XMU15]|uniref:Uncharacterized protein n=1 Tax=Saccharomonospora marina XMU15 TaxID=882083 RepID=H5X5M8_9PSEU|nr:hypothetical protein [Saccharomonospora marina]EHR51176.1 hypothetical protein SacmaDRAFT_2938 [Saccharomonospora marina XMU15]
MAQEAEEQQEFSRRRLWAMAVLTVLGLGMWVVSAVTIGVPPLMWFFGGLLLLGGGGYWWAYLKYRRRTR